MNYYFFEIPKITFGENYLPQKKKKHRLCFLSNTWCGVPTRIFSACFCSFRNKINFRLLKNLNTWWNFVAMMAMTAMMQTHRKNLSIQKKMFHGLFSGKRGNCSMRLHGYIGFGLLERKSSVSILSLPHLFCCSWAVAWLSMAKASSESFWI